MDRIGRYDVIEVISSSGAGAVYRARDPLLARDVAIYMFWDGEGGDRGERLLARFRHPNIVGIYDAGVHQGRPFHVLEYVDGRSLAAMIGDGVRVSSAAALGMAEVMARALHHLHLHGVVHRAVTPANVVLRSSGEPVLVDFRTACELAPDALQADIAGVADTLCCALLGRLGATARDLEQVAPPYVADLVMRCRAGQFSSADALAGSLNAAHEMLAQADSPTVRSEPREGETVLFHGEHHDDDRHGGYREYQILARVSAGGFGEVYRALDRLTGETVALKLLKTDLLRDADAIARFRREADVLAFVHHPNVVRIFNYGRYGASVFIAMELIEGPTLAEVRARHAPMPVRRAMDLVTPLLDALDVLSRSGIVHRDVKPTNIKLCGERVVLLDFGIARVEGWDTLTEEAAFIGTLRYAAPEQLTGHGVTAASDVYAVGVILYELLTGRSPHDAAHPTALMLRIATEPFTPIDVYRNDLPPRIVNLLECMLDRDPLARPSAATAARWFDEQRAEP